MSEVHDALKVALDCKIPPGPEPPPRSRSRPRLGPECLAALGALADSPPCFPFALSAFFAFSFCSVCRCLPALVFLLLSETSKPYKANHRNCLYQKANRLSLLILYSIL